MGNLWKFLNSPKSRVRETNLGSIIMYSTGAVSQIFWSVAVDSTGL